MLHTAALVSADETHSPMEGALRNAGFDVVALRGRGSGSNAAFLRRASPVLMVVEAGVREDMAEQWVRLGVDERCLLLVTGDSTVQQRLSDRIAAGRVVFMAEPLDNAYLDELFADLYQEAAVKARGGCGAVPDVAMDQFGMIHGSSPAMRTMYRFLRKAAASEAVLCIHGESGTGKELVAEAVHAYSPRKEAPFEAINCAAIPADLVESELFGHEKGSFSGAVYEHIGVFERVGSGTLLLDEITEMPQGMQVKLLRVLESGRFRRVGGEVDHRYDARIIAATNREPIAAVREGKLREDLYYRISQLEVRVPALRERGRDIVGLARKFVVQFDLENDQQLTLTPGAEEALLSYSWPGNVRQLWNVVQKACTTARETINVSDLPLEQEPAASLSPGHGAITLPVNCTLDESEKQLILACLGQNGGDKQLTAEVLGISLRTLYSRLAKYKAQG